VKENQARQGDISYNKKEPTHCNWQKHPLGKGAGGGLALPLGDVGWVSRQGEWWLAKSAAWPCYNRCM